MEIQLSSISFQFILISIFYILNPFTIRNFLTLLTSFANLMLTSTLGHSRLSRQSCSPAFTTRQQDNSTFHDKHMPSKLALTCRSYRENNYHSRTQVIYSSFRDKQNDPHIGKDFSMLVQPTFTKKPSLTKRTFFSRQIHLTQTNLNFQNICLTQTSPSSRSHRDSSRSNSKRKKKTQHLFNFSAKNSSKERQSTKTTRQNTFKDSYIKNFLSTNKSQFVSTNNSQLKDYKKTQENENSNQSNRYDQDKSQNNGLILKQSNYQKIRQKMKKLKNMTEVRQFKRKPLKYKTTQQEWNQIERVVRMVCKDEMKRVDTEETLETQIRTSINNLDEDCEKEGFKDGESEDGKQKENNLLEDNKVPGDICQQQMVDETKKQTHQVKKTVDQKPQPQPGLQNSIPLQNKQKSNQILSHHTQPQKFPQTQLSSLKPPSSLSSSQFSSLLLIYQHTLYMVPSIIHKVTSLCQSHQLDFQIPIFLFFKQMCLNKKLIQSIFDQQPQSFFTQHKVYDYSDVVKQIRKANASNIAALEGLRPDVGDKKAVKISSELSLSLLTGKESIDVIREYINTMKRDFTALNMKLIKKLLKRISKSPTTNIKQFQVFLNYCSCFLNLSLVHQTIQKVLNCSIKLTQSQKSQGSPQKEQLQTRQFLYKDCGFIKNKYLGMKEKVFEMCFDIQDEHKKIQTYYHELINEIKRREQVFKGEK